jgi:hypothetical protein
MKALPASAAPAEEVRSCLWHAARVLPNNEKDMIRMLDNMASTLPTIYSISQPNHALPDQSASTTTSRPEPCHYLGVKWDHETRNGSFGGTFLSLAVIHGVTAYVKARATHGCLVQQPCYEGKSITWPLLMDAVCTGSFRAEMVKCLLSLGADPNYVVSSSAKGTPWRVLLSLIRSTHNYQLSSVRALRKECQEVVEAMVVSRADLDSAWNFYVPRFTNRFGFRVKLEVVETIPFTDGFFEDLQNLAPRDIPEEKSRKWFKVWGTKK